MNKLLRACLDTLVLRNGPQAFPASSLLCTIMLLSYLLVDAVQAFVQGRDGRMLLAVSLFDTGLWVLLFAVLMLIKGMLPRYQQSLSAWFGATTILTLIGLPVDLAGRLLTEQQAAVWVLLPEVLLLAWSIMVLTQVLRYALNVGLIFALCVAAPCTFINIVVLQSLFPLD